MSTPSAHRKGPDPDQFDPDRFDPNRFELDQARRRAKELLAAVRAGDAASTKRLVRPHHPPRLSDAQHAVAVEYGFADWPALVRATKRFDAVDADAVDWDRVTEVTVVCFPSTGQVSLLRDGDRWVCPHDRRGDGEDVWDDSILRIGLQRMGFRRQGTHVSAVDRTGRHIVFWIDGAPYTGLRPHRDDAQTWTAPAAEAAELLRAQGDHALAGLVQRAAEQQRTMTYEQHQRDLTRTLTGVYLRAETLPGGSGFGGTEQDWHDAREVLTAALEGLPDDLDRPDAPVSFLDLGCANGHLAASFVPWGAARSVTVEPYGVDLSPELVERARALHPQWADRFWVGDASTWRHPDGMRFDLVHLLLDVFPEERRGAAIEHGLSLVTPGGRLLVSHYDNRPEHSAEVIVRGLGHEPVGRTPVRLRRGNGRPYGTPSVWLRT